MMFDVVASNEEKTPPVWLERGHRIISIRLRRSFEYESSSLSQEDQKSEHVIQQDVAPAHTPKTVQDWLDVNMSFFLKILASTVTEFVNAY